MAIYKILIPVVLGIFLWRCGNYVGREQCERQGEKRIAESLEIRVVQHEKIRARVLAVSRSDNACWLCENYAAHDGTDDVSASAAVQDIPANE